MKQTLSLVATVWLLSLTPTAVFAKIATIGIYAVIDEVTFERDGPSSTRIRISGVFVVPVPMSSGAYKAPQRGYLYFKIPSGLEEETLKDWSALKAAAGTGRAVGFVEYFESNPNDPHGNPHHSLEVAIHTVGDGASPDLYPHPHLKGIVTSGDMDDRDFEKIAGQLRKASQPGALR
jgi:hypothetical protein